MEVAVAIEDHPKFPAWKAAFEKLVETVEAQKQGKALARDVELAKEEYFKIADDL